MDILMDRVTLVVFMAVVVNALVEYLIKPVIDKVTALDGEWRDYVLRIASAGVGVGIAAAFQLNVFVGFGLGISTDTQVWVSVILTGLLMARPSNWLADLLKKRPTPGDWALLKDDEE